MLKGKQRSKIPKVFPANHTKSTYEPSLDSAPASSEILGSTCDREDALEGCVDSFLPWSLVASVLVLRKVWYWFQKPAELLVAGTLRDAEEGSWSEDERLPLAGGRDALSTPPWCFMCPWELAEFKPVCR